MLPSPFWQYNINSTIEYPGWVLPFGSFKTAMADFRQVFFFFFYNPFLSYCELFKMSKYANHSWPLLNHKTQCKIKLTFELSVRKYEEKKTSLLLSYFRFCCSDSLQSAQPSPHRWSRWENFGWRLCLSKPRRKYSMWHISIPKSHTLIGCRLKLIDLADSFKAPEDN